MNPTPASPVLKQPGESRRLRLLAVALSAAVFLPPALLVAGVASCFRHSSDTKALLNGLEKCTRTEWQKRIAVNVGGFTLGAVRSGLSFAHLNPEALAVLRSVRGVEVGIYQLSGGVDSRDCAAMLAATDTAMNASGWERVVGVIDDKELVAVYVPIKIPSPRKMKCCVTVFDGRQMVVVSARVNPDPLVQSLLHHPALRTRMQLLAQR